MQKQTPIVLLAAGLWVAVFGWIGVMDLQAEPEPQQWRPHSKPSSNLDTAVEDDLTYLLDLVRSNDESFAPGHIRALIDYCRKGQTRVEKNFPASRFGGPGTVVRGRIRVPVGKIGHYLYNPRLPTYLMMPMMLRLSGWHPGSDLLSQDAALWNTNRPAESPLLLRGREFEVTTPDTRSGGYYRYDLDRLLLSLNVDGLAVLISVSRAIEPSDVGKRAFIIDDENWAYFYSNETGLSLNLVQWMDTYIYDTASVMIFHASEKERGYTNVTLFKWLNAGWLGMNVVRAEHIRQGSRRSVTHLKQILESENLPDPETLASRYARVRSLSDTDLDRLVSHYARHIEKAAMQHDELSGEEYEVVLQNGGYARLLKRPERIGAVMVEYLKQSLGKKSFIKPDLFDTLLTQSPASQLAPNVSMAKNRSR
jgi:hypothetical protein